MAKKIDKQALRRKIQELQIDNSLKSELLAAISEKKTFGLVWEEKEEEAQDILRENIPVLTEIQERRIISNGEDAPNHVLIEGDNLHALTALTYSHEGQFDAIYIDPPYNSGARDWRYNNDYVDKEDSYRHSKWLSMMYHRLKIASKLLNKENSVLIVTIDEKEYHHLGCLLEEMFPDGRMQMISTVINVKGVAREKEFSRVNEYIYIVQFGESKVESLSLEEEWLGNVRKSGRDKVRLGSMLRSGSNSERSHSPGCFYPMIFDKEGKFKRAGEPIPLSQPRESVSFAEDEIGIWPIHSNGTEGVWQYGKASFEKLLSDGYVYFGKIKNGRVGISYAPKGVQKKIQDGLFSIAGYNEDGTVIIDDSNYESTFIPGNQWAIPSHNATEYGSKLLKDMFDDKVFAYPKSIFAVKDTLRFFVANKPNAKILDFFAGSGTTLHATMLLNSEDNGSRQCILVTNNENNICEDVTYQRNKKVIEGYTTATGNNVPPLPNNTLRYYITEFVPRSNTSANRRELISASVDLLCIKENIYNEQESFGGRKFKKTVLRYFEDRDKQMLVIFDERVISLVIPMIAEVAKKESPMKVFVFSDGQYAYEDEFHEVISQIDLCALPDAIYQALNSVLPEQQYSEEMIAEFNEEEAEAALADTYNYKVEEGGAL